MTQSRFLNTLPAFVLLLAGLALAWGGSRYSVGSLTAMGPGFLPLALGLCLALFSFVLFWLDKSAEPASERSLTLRPVLCVGTGMVLWALVIDTAGFIPAGLLQLLLSALALPQPHWRNLLFGAVVLSLVAYGLFVQLLGMPLAAFGS